ncbi:MAG: hypothetical protein ACK6DP_05125 [Gemmatimonas sp.]|jgi:hypothetical protein|uniref:hypothetical protein n=1 Tax=Gemmatimonas sp. TaxID=1962908 RepID=UPI00391F98B5
MTAPVKLVKGGRPPVEMPAVVIEKGVPVPPLTERMPLPFSAMEVGDSFFVAAKYDALSVMARIRSRHRYWQMGQCPRPEMRITIRRVAGGVRCWRVG